MIIPPSTRQLLSLIQKIVKQLIDAKADLSIPSQGSEPLYSPAYYGNAEIIRLLINAIYLNALLVQQPLKIA